MSQVDIQRTLTSASGWRATAVDAGSKRSIAYGRVERFWLDSTFAPMFVIEVWYDGDVVTKKVALTADGTVSAPELRRRAEPLAIVVAGVCAGAITVCVYLTGARRRLAARPCNFIMVGAVVGLLALLLLGLFGTLFR